MAAMAARGNALSRFAPPVARSWVHAAMLLAFLGLMLAAVLPAWAADDTVGLITKSGRHPISVEWAVTPDERSKGLMFRKTMPEDHGMLFDFGYNQSVSFWMHNTPLSLDMVFIAADGTVKRIEHRAEPFSDKVIPAGFPVRYVLEINGGRAAALGLAPGDMAEIPAH